jgi:hypothetical protein
MLLETIWWNYFDTIHNIQSPLYFFQFYFFGFERSWISTNLYDFLQLCTYYMRVVCITNVKTCNVFDNDPMKMFPKQKTRMKVKIKFKILKYCNFYQVNCNLWWNIFCDEFLNIWACKYFFSLLVICIYLRCYTTNGFHLTLLCKTKWLKNLIDQKNKDVLFFSMLFLCIYLLIKILYWHVGRCTNGWTNMSHNQNPYLFKIMVRFWKLQVVYTSLHHYYISQTIYYSKRCILL